MSSISDYDRVPDWAFGEVLQHTQSPDTRLLFLSWEYVVDHNWYESIFKGLCIASEGGAMVVGAIYQLYCGWYRPVKS